MFAYGYENDTLHASVITKKRCIVSFFSFLVCWSSCDDHWKLGNSIIEGWISRFIFVKNVVGNNEALQSPKNSTKWSFGA